MEKWVCWFKSSFSRRSASHRKIHNRRRICKKWIQKLHIDWFLLIHKTIFWKINKWFRCIFYDTFCKYRYITLQKRVLNNFWWSSVVSASKTIDKVYGKRWQIQLYWNDSLISIKENAKDILIPSEERHAKMYPMDLRNSVQPYKKNLSLDILKNVLQNESRLKRTHEKAILLF